MKTGLDYCQINGQHLLVYENERYFSLSCFLCHGQKEKMIVPKKKSLVFLFVNVVLSVSNVMVHSALTACRSWL